MARFHDHVNSWADADKFPPKMSDKDRRRGAMEDAFWPEDELVDYRKVKTKKAKRSKGCPENNGNAHVYVAVNRVYELWAGKMFKTTTQVCCGCSRVKGGRGRLYSY